MAELDEKQAERKRLKEERKQLKADEKQHKKEAKQRAKEIAKEEMELDPDEEAGGFSVFFVTIIIVAIWVAILCLLIKLDIGGFGSNVLHPVLKNVPVVNLILPEVRDADDDTYAPAAITEEAIEGYGSLEEAVAYIKQLEFELEQAKNATVADAAEVEELKAEVQRLRTFEESQVEFERIKDQFYDEVIYATNGPGIEAYREYYESIDAENAAKLYKQVVEQEQIDVELKDYITAYSSMKPKNAAAIFNGMTEDLDLVAQILDGMDPDARGKILAAMDTDVAAKVTKLMDPNY